MCLQLPYAYQYIFFTYTRTEYFSHTIHTHFELITCMTMTVCVHLGSRILPQLINFALHSSLHYSFSFISFHYSFSFISFHYSCSFISYLIISRTHKPSQDSMWKRLTIRTSVSLCGTWVDRTRSDHCGDTILSTHRYNVRCLSLVFLGYVNDGHVSD